MPNKHQFPHSTSIQECDYDHEKKELEICFSSGHRHKFSDVPKEVYEELKQAKSPGSFFHMNIRKVYKSNKL